MLVHIVEDDEAVADALAFALEGLDHFPKIYPDGETFLAQSKLSAGDWVIVDLGLPGMSGSALVRRLKNLPAPPRIIAISGKPRIKLIQHLRDMPEITVLRKPLSIEMLTAAMA